MRFFLLLGIVLSSAVARSQTWEWWANLVKWDGVSPWQHYLITAPKYLGPNALPVPFITNGSIDSVNALGVSGAFHFSEGDNTQNIVLYGNYCLVKNVISFDASYIPYEHYTMSHAIKEERHVFSHYYYDTKAHGDLHLNMNINLLNKWRKHIQLAGRLGYRYPTSSGIGTARFIDAPGYYLDISFGIPFRNHPSFKWIGMAGLYSWQTNLAGKRQDDAFLFGGGLEFNKKSFRIQSYVTGYLGYMESYGDKPVVFRTGIEKRWNHFIVFLRFQEGLHDFEYTSIESGLKYAF
jgi:hypothetical protein